MSLANHADSIGYIMPYLKLVDQFSNKSLMSSFNTKIPFVINVLVGLIIISLSRSRIYFFCETKISLLDLVA